jgi:23S rRNA (cytidine1920-2'-O)/16S rRNA (cytidine1409-2'-O)-methyltransferase
MRKLPVWELLINRGLFDNKKSIESWIMAGKVLVNKQRVYTVGQMVLPTDEIVVRGINQKYVSKGGLKLEGALSDFNINLEGLVAIDAGASTGGFTDCLLQHGASKVYAVDVGYGQLAGKLRVDSRVVNMEKVNISDIIQEHLTPNPTLATVDLSYLSLKDAIPIFAAILNFKGELICLVKPLFEVENSEIRRTGKISDINTYKEILINLVEYTNDIGYKVIGITHSHITGNNGTIEFFLRIALDPNIYQNYVYYQQLTDIDRAIQSALELEVFKR